MPTLAHKLINLIGVSTDLKSQKMMQLLRTYLQPSAGATVLENSKKLAERFVFNCNPAREVYEQIENGALTDEMPFKFARPVCDPMWIEWVLQEEMMLRTSNEQTARKVTGVHLGTLIINTSKLPTNEIIHPAMKDRGLNDRTIFVHCADIGNGSIGPYMLTSVPMMPLDTESVVDMNVHWSLYGADEEEAEMGTARKRVIEVIDALFLLSVPRVCEYEYVKAPRAERRRAEREGKSPELEYRKVKLMLGDHTRKISAREEKLTDEEISHKRLHKVIGHFRTYTKDRPEPKVSFIPEHWRGDAALGVIMHEHHVQRQDK